MIQEFLADCQSELGSARPISVWRVVKLIYAAKGLKALLGYRLGKKLQGMQSNPWCWPLLAAGWPIYFLLSRYVHLVYDIRLELSATIGPGLYIGHFGDILLSHCQLGRNCSISQSVHITPAPADTLGPQLGDFVWMGAQAKVIGNYRVGDRCTISAGTVVPRDLPERSLIMGNPGRLALRDYDNSQLLRIAN